MSEPECLDISEGAQANIYVHGTDCHHMSLVPLRLWLLLLFLVSFLLQTVWLLMSILMVSVAV